MKREITYLLLGMCGWISGSTIVFLTDSPSALMFMLILILIVVGVIALVRKPFQAKVHWRDRTKLQQLEMVAAISIGFGFSQHLEHPELFGLVKYWPIQLGVLLFYLHHSIRLLTLSDAGSEKKVV